MNYQNFALELSALPDGRYRISVQSPLGEATVDVDNPFTDAEIEQILAILGRDTSAKQAEINTLARTVGDKLFTFLFHSSNQISNAYFASLARLGENGLRLRISVENSGKLSHLPWELMRDPARDYLTLSRRTPVVRYTQQLTTRRPTALNLPLRVLVMISSPKDFAPLDVEGEWKRLQDATADLRKKGLLEFERVDNATLITLQRTLRTNDYHAFHFIGHSDFDPQTGQGVLVFEDSENGDKGRIISGAALARELGEESTIRLVVLNSCKSSRRLTQDPFTGIASSIVTRGIPAVVAMQFVISDRAAKIFAEEFYRSLAEFYPIDSAVSEARRAIANELGNNEWSTPVLYMRAQDGHLFRSTTEVAESSGTQKPIIAQQSAEKKISPAVWIGGTIGAVVLLLLLGSLLTPIINPPPPTLTPTLAVTNTPALLPDLQVSRVRIVPLNPAPGQFFRVNITLTNAGEAPSGAFSWSWDASVQDPIQLNTQTGIVDNIPPGSSKTISFPYLFGWWGTYNTLINIDVDSVVIESNKRNNRLPFEVTIAPLPFNIDFAILPDNSLVETPLTLGSDTFSNWNLDFVLAVPQTDPCFATPMQLLESLQDQDIFLAPQSGSCDQQPLSIRLTRQAIGNAEISILAANDGIAEIRLFSDVAGAQLVAERTDISLTAGQMTNVSGFVTNGGSIRRIDVLTTGQRVQITRLALSPAP